MKSFDHRTRTKIESAIGFGETMFGGLTGYGVNYSDLFGLGVALSDGDMMQLGEIQSIEMMDSNTAIVKVSMRLNTGVGSYNSGYTTEIVQFEMTKEDCGWLNHDWFIKDMYSDN